MDLTFIFLCFYFHMIIITLNHCNVCHKMDSRLDRVCSVVHACVRGNPASVRLYLPRLIEAVLALLRSPLGAPRCAELFVHLHHAAFENYDLGLGKHYKACCYFIGEVNNNIR